ncbi:hypothetical protein LLG95_08615 [bacterium]|nr:hypothetical protein [bacterium]
MKIVLLVVGSMLIAFLVLVFGSIGYEFTRPIPEGSIAELRQSISTNQGPYAGSVVLPEQSDRGTSAALEMIPRKDWRAPLPADRWPAIEAMNRRYADMLKGFADYQKNKERLNYDDARKILVKIYVEFSDLRQELEWKGLQSWTDSKMRDASNKVASRVYLENQKFSIAIVSAFVELNIRHGKWVDAAQYCNNWEFANSFSEDPWAKEKSLALRDGAKGRFYIACRTIERWGNSIDRSYREMKQGRFKAPRPGPGD